MLDKKIVIKLLSSVLISTFLISPVKAYAWGGDSDWHHRRNHRRDHFRHYEYPRHYPARGTIIFDLPFGAVKVSIGGSRYYFCDGVYYRRAGFNYVVIPPPTGAVVTAVPVGIQPVIINGETYYTSNSIYYQYTPQGYMVVPQPTTPFVQTAQRVDIVSPANIVEDTIGTLTVNVTNSQGGYTAVTLKRKSNGFIGPQGEFYPEFPSVEQLKVMYAK